MMLIEQISAIKKLIDQNSYALTTEQVDTIHSKFMDWYENYF